MKFKNKQIILIFCIFVAMCIYMIVASIIQDRKQASNIPSTFAPATITDVKDVIVEYSEDEYDNDSDMSEPTFYLSDYERWIVECIVMGESGGESYEGQLLVAECILNACIKDEMQPSEVRMKYQYSGWNDNPSQSVRDAVSNVFDKGYKMTDEFILYFYAPKYVYSEWHETQKFVCEVGGHRFFAEW